MTCLVLLRVLSDGVPDLKDGVVVAVGDGDPLVVLQVDVVDAPRLVGDGLADDVDRPRVGLADLEEGRIFSDEFNSAFKKVMGIF